jgi:hypothetical protein
MTGSATVTATVVVEVLLLLRLRWALLPRLAVVWSRPVLVVTRLLLVHRATVHVPTILADPRQRRRARHLARTHGSATSRRQEHRGDAHRSPVVQIAVAVVAVRRCPGRTLSCRRSRHLALSPGHAHGHSPCRDRDPDRRLHRLDLNAATSVEVYGTARPSL